MIVEDRNKINVTLNTKGVLVYTRSKTSNGKWILLIDHIEAKTGIFGSEYEMIYAYASICVNKGLTYPIWSKSSFPFGVTRSFDFYEVTEEERKHMQDFIKRNGLKYVKALNKIIDR